MSGRRARALRREIRPPGRGRVFLVVESGTCFASPERRAYQRAKRFREPAADAPVILVDRIRAEDAAMGRTWQAQRRRLVRFGRRWMTSRGRKEANDGGV